MGSSRSARSCRSPLLPITPMSPSAPIPEGFLSGRGATWRLKVAIRRVFAENFEVYGVRKVWLQLNREGVGVARCTVARLMRAMGLQGVMRGKPVRTTIQGQGRALPLDRVNRQFKAPAPNQLWVSDFTYVSTWGGMVYVAFVIDVYARRIVGWRASRTAHASFVLERWSRLCMNAGLFRRWARSPQRSRQPICLDQIHRTAGRGRHRAVSGKRRQFLRQRSRRNHQRALQSGGHSSTRTLAEFRSRRVRDARMGRLVQSPPAAGAYRKHPPAEAEACYYALNNQAAMAA